MKSTRVFNQGYVTHKCTSHHETMTTSHKLVTWSCLLGCPQTFGEKVKLAGFGEKVGLMWSLRVQSNWDDENEEVAVRYMMGREGDGGQGEQGCWTS